MIYLSPLQVSPEDDRDYPYVPLASIPEKAGFDVGEIEDQLTIGSCTANAVVSAAEAHKAGHLSRLFNYHLTREYEGRLGQEGAVLRNAVKMAVKFGLPPEDLWPYDIAKAETAPTADVRIEAAKRTIKEYRRIDLSGDWLTRVHAIKSAISEGYPVVFGMPVTTQFMQLTKSTAKAYAGSKFPWWPKVGNHAMCFYGYDKDYIDFENSWNTTWGDSGKGSLRIGLVEEIFEAWAICGFDGVDRVKPGVESNYGKAYRLYRAAFGRTPDAAGLAFWQQALDNGTALLDVANGFIDSAEFRSLYTDNPPNRDFALLLYTNVLHRNPDADGLNWWIERLDSGVTKAEVLVGFSESPENKAGVTW